MTFLTRLSSCASRRPRFAERKRYRISDMLPEAPRDLIAHPKRVLRQFVEAAFSGGWCQCMEQSLEGLIRDLLRQVIGNGRQIARITFQTAVAVTATYILLTWMNARFLSWGIISALFTIGVSADATYYNALGRIFGALIGAAIGLVAALSAGPMILGLVISTALANVIAAVWPSLRYAAVTAAIVALESDPELGSVFDRVSVILIGTAAGIGASFWSGRSSAGSAPSTRFARRSMSARRF